MRLGIGWRLLVCNVVVAVLSLMLAGAVLAVPVSTQPPGPAGRVSVKKKQNAKPLTTAQVIALIRRFAGQGPAGPGGAQGLIGSQGAQGPIGAQGAQGLVGPSTGAAGGTLAGSYPNPTLSVSGGPCANGRALTNVSNLAALTCAPGVYSDAGQNVAAGPNPFGVLTTGNNNVAVGPSMLTADTTGNNNSALGRNALNANTTGNSNSAFGQSALLSNTGGDANSVVGWQALAYNSGDNNTAVGRNAGEYMAAGSDNILLGQNAGVLYNSAETSNIVIGNNGVAAENNTIRIGKTGVHTRAFLAGVRTASTGVNNAVAVLIDSNGQLGITSSSRRFKTDIQPLGSGTDRLMALRPVSFHYKQYARGPNDRTEYGLIAEDVARVFPDLVVNGPDGKPFTVMYQQLPALLLAQIQQQQRQIQRQHQQAQRQIAKLEAQNRRLRHQQNQIDWLMRHARLR